MSDNLSEECKKRLKEFEKEIIWSLKMIKSSDYKHLLFQEIIAFLSLSCRFLADEMDELCKQLMSGYEDDIINLNFSPVRDKITSIENLLVIVRNRGETHAR